MSENTHADHSLDPVDSSGSMGRLETALVKKELEEIDPSIFRGIPPDTRDRIVDTVGIFISMTHHEGPLPSVRTLEGYHKLIPEGAERIMFMAEKQQQHRMTMENKVLQAEISQSLPGQWLAFAIGISTLTTCGFCAYIGEPILAGVIGTGGLIGLVSVFIQGRKSQQEDLKDKRPPEPHKPPGNRRKQVVKRKPATGNNKLP